MNSGSTAMSPEGTAVPATDPCRVTARKIGRTPEEHVALEKALARRRARRAAKTAAGSAARSPARPDAAVTDTMTTTSTTKYKRHAGSASRLSSLPLTRPRPNEDRQPAAHGEQRSRDDDQGGMSLRDCFRAMKALRQESIRERPLTAKERMKNRSGKSRY